MSEHKSVPEWADGVRNRINTALQFLAINSVGDAERHLKEARDLIPDPLEVEAQSLVKAWGLAEENGSTARVIKWALERGIELALEQGR